MAEILFDVLGTQLGVITLNRPEALNALTQSMCSAMDEQLIRWEQDPAIKTVVVRAQDKGFCAGGDIRQIYQNGLRGDPHVLEFFKDEYQLNRRIYHYSKPYIALLDGLTFGGGVGISVHGSYRIATEKTLFAMPETSIGFFPDVGGSYFLPRLPGRLGFYLGLTGARLKAGDLISTGIATHYVDRNQLDDLVKALAQFEFNDDLKSSIEHCLALYAGAPEPGTLNTVRTDIDHCFNHNSIEAIISALQEKNSDWAQTTLNALQQSSPTSLNVTLRLLEKGADLDFDDCMAMEYIVTQHFLKHPDFYEGVRAKLIDKDQNPRWKSSLSEVKTEDVDVFFSAGADIL